MSAPSAPGSGLEVKAVIAAAVGSSLVGTVPYFAIGLYKQGMDVASVLLWRYWLALAVLVPIAVLTSPNLRDDWQKAGRGLFLNGAIIGLAQTYTYFRAVQTVPSSVVITVFFTYPMITLALDRLLFGLAVRWPSLLAVTMIFIGAMLTGWPSLRLDGGDLIGMICTIATPIIYSAYIAVAYRYTRQGSPFASASAIYLGLGCGYAIVVLVLGGVLPVGFDQWRSLLAIALVGGVIQVASFAYALPRLSASGYSIIVSLELVTVVLMGVLLLGEALSPAQIAGIGLVGTGIVVDRLFRARR